MTHASQGRLEMAYLLHLALRTRVPTSYFLLLGTKLSQGLIIPLSRGVACASKVSISASPEGREEGSMKKEM